MLIDEDRDDDRHEGLSLDDAIAAAFDGTDLGEAGGSTDTQPAAPGQGRDQQGRFAAKEPTDGQTAAPPSQDQQQAQGTAPAATRKAPAAWPAEKKEAFAALDPAIQDIILKREQDVSKGFEERAAKVRTADDFERILSPHAATMQRLGLSGTQAVERLLQAQARLQSDPRGALLDLARTYGVDLTGGQPANPQAAPVHPIQRQLQQMGQTLSELQSERERERQAAQAREHETLTTTLSQFASSHEHYETVRGTMAHLMNSGQATTLEDAYDKACWLEPTIRDSLIAARSAPAAAAEKAFKEQERVQRARGAASSVRGAPAGTTAPPAKKASASIEDDIRAAFATLE